MGRSWKLCAFETKDCWTKYNMIHVSSVTNIENKKIQKHFVTICNIIRCWGTTTETVQVFMHRKLKIHT